jgi:phosphatidylglycerophosphate synthase
VAGPRTPPLRELLATVPNRLTAARLALLPLMWLFAWLGMPVWIGIGTFTSFVTDVLDGYVARRLNQVSDFGAKFDSFADNLMLPSALIWLWMFRPEVYRDNALVCAAAVVLYAASMLLGAVKFRRFANLHLYSSKAASIPMYLFFSSALVMGRYSRWLFFVAAGMFIASCVERLLVLLASSHVDEHIGSIVFMLLKRPPVAPEEGV